MTATGARLGRMVGNIVRFRVLNWVDLELSSTTLVVEGAGTFQMGMFFLGMNANPQMFKRERILSPTEAEEEYPKPQLKDQPLEITVTIRDLYFSINGKEFTEIAKTVVLTVDFELGGEYGVQSVKAALRIAGFSIPYDNLMTFKDRITEMKTTRPGTPPRPRPSSPSTRPNLAFLDIFEEIQVSHPSTPLLIVDPRHATTNISRSQWCTSTGKTNSHHPWSKRRRSRLNQTRKSKRPKQTFQPTRSSRTSSPFNHHLRRHRRQHRRSTRSRRPNLQSPTNHSRRKNLCPKPLHKRSTRHRREFRRRKHRYYFPINRPWSQSFTTHPGITQPLDNSNQVLYSPTNSRYYSGDAESASCNPYVPSPENRHQFLCPRTFVPNARPLAPRKQNVSMEHLKFAL